MAVGLMEIICGLQLNGMLTISLIKFRRVNLTGYSVDQITILVGIHLGHTNAALTVPVKIGSKANTDRIMANIFLYQELSVFREEFLNRNIEPCFNMNYNKITMWGALFSAELIRYFDASRIVDTYIQYNENLIEPYSITIIDEDGNSFFLHLDSNGRAGIM